MARRAGGAAWRAGAAPPLLALALLGALAAGARGIEFDLVDRGSAEGAKNAHPKCVMEELNENVMVIMDYHSVDGTHVNIVVTDPIGGTLFTKDDAPSGQTAFTTTRKGDFKACFTRTETHEDPETHRELLEKHKVKLTWKTGVSATDWESLAKKEVLDAVSMNLRELEAELKEIYDGMLYMRRREEEMRDLNEATNARVARYSIISLAMSLSLSVWQLWYMRNFFHKKKLI